METALILARQGHWTEAEYLRIADHTNRLIEFSDGCLEILPMPTVLHQRIVQFLFKALEAFVLAHRLGEVFMAPLPIRLQSGRMREPDILFVRPGRIKDPRRPPRGADLVMEVVSEGDENRRRDVEIKPADYARARIGEYWIVDPQAQRITVLRLVGKRYRIHGEFTPEMIASSALLKGFQLSVAEVFAAGTRRPKNGTGGKK